VAGIVWYYGSITPMSSKYRSGPSFTIHVPVHPFGTDPSQTVKAWGQPNPIRQTEEYQWISREGGRGAGIVGLMSNDTGVGTPATAGVTVTQANVTPGTHVIRIGKYELRPAVDFVVGAGDVALAANLASAIDALPEFTATSDGVDTVTINTVAGHGDDHRIEVVEWGAASAFVVSALTRTGYLNRGDPQPKEPTFA